MEQDLGTDGNIDIVTGYTFNLQGRLQSTTTTIGSESITTKYFYGPDGTAFLNSGYDAYHLAALYFSYIYGFINRI